MKFTKMSASVKYSEKETIIQGATKKFVCGKEIVRVRSDL